MPFLSLCPLPSSPPAPPPSRLPPLFSPSVELRLRLRSLRLAAFPLPAAARGHDGKFHPSPSHVDEDPPEAPEGSSRSATKHQHLHGGVSQARKTQGDQFKDQSFLVSEQGSRDESWGDAGEQEVPPGGNLGSHALSAASSTTSSSFDPDLDSSGEPSAPFVEPKFRMTLAKLLEESGVVPVSVHGDLDVAITGVQHDSKKVSTGDLFVCCVGSKTDGHLCLSEALKRGAVAVVSGKVIDMNETLGFKVLVLVEDTTAMLPVLAASFYGNPSKSMIVIGITGTNGKTTTSHLVRRVYEAMALKTGMLGTVGYYVDGGSHLEASLTTPDAVTVQKFMATMVHNATEAIVMEASSHGLALGRCDAIDFDIAVFTNLTRDHYDFHGGEEEYRKSKGKLFAKMIHPEHHRKVLNIDDPNAPFFVAQGNLDVPVVTYAIENKSADVYPLKFELSLTKTEVWVNTPKGTLKISSDLIGRHNIYNILAATAVGIAADAPLEAIVRGIEEVDAVPGRCESIDEEQAFAVIVDYAHTPDALSRLLDAVKELGPRRTITVFGCGGDRDRGKRPMMTKTATDKSDIVILTSDNPRTENPWDILGDMLAGVGWTIQDYLRHGEIDHYLPLPNGCKLFIHEGRRIAIRTAVAMAEEGDIVVIAGKGHETYQIEGDKKRYFDDREECREALHFVHELHQAGIDK